MKITVDQDLCVATGQCVRTAPDVFDQREEDGVVTLLTDDAPADQRQAVEEATHACPVGALRLHPATT